MERIRLHENPYRQLGYSQEFKQRVAEHPGVLNRAIELAQQAEEGYRPRNVTIGAMVFRWNPSITEFEIAKIGTRRIPSSRTTTYSQRFPLSRGVLFAPGKTLRDKTTGLEVTTLGKSRREFATGLLGTGAVFRVDDTAYFRMALGNDAFFVKKSTATDNVGYDEFKTSNLARTALSSMDDLEVVESQLGYNDDRQSWFVSKWKDLDGHGFFPLNTWMGGASPNDYGETLSILKEDSPQKWIELFKLEEAMKGKAKAITDEIRMRLEGSGITLEDVSVNLFYNPDTDKYFLLDVTNKNRSSSIGQPPQPSY